MQEKWQAGLDTLRRIEQARAAAALWSDGVDLPEYKQELGQAAAI